MRRALLPGLLRAAARNQAHQRPSGRLFEIGATYAPRPDGLADERERLAALLFGAPSAAGLAQPRRPRSTSTPPPGWPRPSAGACGSARRRGAGRRPALRAPGPSGRPAAPAGRTWAGPARSTRSCCASFDVRGPAAARRARPRRRCSPPAGRDAGSSPTCVSVPVSTRDLAVVVGRGTSRAADLVARRPGEAGGARWCARPVVFDRYEGDPVPDGPGEPGPAPERSPTPAARSPTRRSRAPWPRAGPPCATRFGAELRA